MKSTFPGFPAEALTFLRGLKKNNRREWFESRKQTFLSAVKEPMDQFIAALNAELAKFAPAFVMDPRKAQYRIYRDTRFSSDKTPYKTHTGALFYRPEFGKGTGAAYYVEVSPAYVGVAGGLYMPGPREILAVRTHIAANAARFGRIIGAKALVSLLGEVAGEALQRPPKGFPATHPAIDLIKMKQWYFWRELDAKLALAPAVVKEAAGLFRAMAPFVEFLNEPIAALRMKEKAQMLKLDDRDW